MFSSLIFSRALSLGAIFLFVRIVRSVAHLVSVRKTLKHVPGPRPSSLLWGEEWLLYHSVPGSLYVDWHNQYGKVVKFTGAFGVRASSRSVSVADTTEQHQILSITDPRAVTYILGDGIYHFPKPHGVREWFKATTGEGILWIEG